MKKVLLSLAVLVILTLCGMFWLNKISFSAPNDAIYINVSNDSILANMKKLKSALELSGKKAILSNSKKHKSGHFNLYTATDIATLPKVSDLEAINFLWIDKLKAGADPEVLRPYDVIIVKTMPAFHHLKAINVRTAFIPDAVDIINNAYLPTPNGKAMFWGDGNEFSLTLLMSGAENISLDVFGKNFEGKWAQNEIKAQAPIAADFRSYSLVLVDQSEEDIRDEIVNERILEVIANGGLPYIRYNPAIEKLFGDAVPMYYNSNEFSQKLNKLLSTPAELQQRKDAIRNIAIGWSSKFQAKKVIELFEIMEKKRI
ncbi:MAG: glycosyltransferase [Acetobacter sp.]|nr:glycosyltransferase [Acetobacter sp.]